MANQIIFNAETKIWKLNVKYPFKDYINQSVGEAFLKNAIETEPNTVIEEFYDIGHKKTMGKLYQESITVATNYLKLGIKPGDITIFYTHSGPKISPLMMGGLLVGATQNVFDTQLNDDNAEYIMELISPTVLIFEKQFNEVVQKLLKKLKLPNLKFCLLIDDDNSDEATVDALLFKKISQSEMHSFKIPQLPDPKTLPAALFFTSGSTGRPKVVSISHSHILNGLRCFWLYPDAKAELTKNSVIFSFGALRWITQVECMLQSYLYSVKRIYTRLPPSGELGVAIIRKTRVTHLFNTPTAFKDVLLATDPTDLDALSSLQVGLIGGETIPQLIFDLATSLAPNCTVFCGYGMTEAGGIVAVGVGLSGCVPVIGTELKVVDENLKPLEPNNYGTFCIRFEVPFLGYYKQPAHEDYLADGFYNTGDYGIINDKGIINIFGRYKYLIKARGKIIIPSQVENLISTLPSILSAVLVGYRQTEQDQDDTGALFVKLNENINDSFAAVKDNIYNLLKLNFPKEDVEIIRDIYALEKFPLMGTKVDRIFLKNLAKTKRLEIE